jgi:hypothetical protein
MTKKFKKKPRLHRVVAIRQLGKNVPGRAIDMIKVQETNGNLKAWKTGDAIDAMLRGTDAFFVVGVIPWVGKGSP